MTLNAAKSKAVFKGLDPVEQSQRMPVRERWALITQTIDGAKEAQITCSRVSGIALHHIAMFSLFVIGLSISTGAISSLRGGAIRVVVFSSLALLGALAAKNVFGVGYVVFKRKYLPETVVAIGLLSTFIALGALGITGYLPNRLALGLPVAIATPIVGYAGLLYIGIYRLPKQIDEEDLQPRRGFVFDKN